MGRDFRELDHDQRDERGETDVDQVPDPVGRPAVACQTKSGDRQAGEGQCRQQRGGTQGGARHEEKRGEGGGEAGNGPGSVDLPRARIAP